MTQAIRFGRYIALHATTPEDILACQRLRHRCFFGTDGVDHDRFDALCQHLMVRDQDSGQLVCTFRLQYFVCGADARASYAAQAYDMEHIFMSDAALAEIGRFCCAPGVMTADVLRVAWAAIAQIVDDGGVAMLFGCSSFPGTDPQAAQDALAVLARRHIGPAHLRPGLKSAKTIALTPNGNTRAGLLQMPSLLKTYLTMGGWVSDHAVIDSAMNTLHVFTGVMIADIPPARAKALRALAAMPGAIL